MTANHAAETPEQAVHYSTPSPSGASSRSFKDLVYSENQKKEGEFQLGSDLASVSTLSGVAVLEARRLNLFMKKFRKHGS